MVLGVEGSVSHSLHHLSGNVMTFGNDFCGTQRLTPIGIVDLNFHLEPSSELSKLKFVPYFGLCTVAERAQSTSTTTQPNREYHQYQ